MVDRDSRGETLKQVLRSAAQLQKLVPDAVLVGGAAAEGWATSVRASSPPLTILGSLDGVEAGLRQMRRIRPLETATVEVDSGITVVVPTIEEMLRIKAYLIVQRNYVRDYLDVVALADAMGSAVAIDVLRHLDDYYADRSAEYGSVLTALVEKLAMPDPRDIDVTLELPRYKGLNERWHEWSNVVAECQQLSLQLAGAS